MTINKKIEKIIHNIFTKYDLIGVIKDGGPEDEYQMEESKLYLYISKNILVSEKEIYQELIKIIEDWFGESPLHNKVLKDLNLMAKEIYKGISNIR